MGEESSQGMTIDEQVKQVAFSKPTCEGSEQQYSGVPSERTIFT